MEFKINDETLHGYGSEDLTLLKWQYAQNSSTESMQSLSKSQVSFCGNQQGDLEIHLESQGSQNS